MKAKAAVMRAAHEPLTIEEIEIDEPARREVLVRTVYAGVCQNGYWHHIALYIHMCFTFIFGKNTFLYVDPLSAYQCMYTCLFSSACFSFHSTSNRACNRHAKRVLCLACGAGTLNRLCTLSVYAGMPHTFCIRTLGQFSHIVACIQRIQVSFLS